MKATKRKALVNYIRFFAPIMSREMKTQYSSGDDLTKIYINYFSCPVVSAAAMMAGLTSRQQGLLVSEYRRLFAPPDTSPDEAFWLYGAFEFATDYRGRACLVGQWRHTALLLFADMIESGDSRVAR